MCKVLGLGLDLCEISRMEALLADDRFLNRYFTQVEIDYIHSRGAFAAHSMAGIWAAKEAVLKAAGTGIACSLKDVEIDHNELGAPVCRLLGAARETVTGECQVSITHEGGMAAAVCLRVGI